MNKKTLFLAFVLCCNNTYSSDNAQSTAQDFFPRFRDFFATLQEAQDRFEQYPSDTTFIPAARKRIGTLITLLKKTDGLCATETEKKELGTLIDELKKIVDRQMTLIRLYEKQNQPNTALQRSHSASTLPTIAQLTQAGGKYASFRKPKQQ